MIDGTKVWVPIDAKLIQDNQFEIIENAEFDNLDTNELYEFLPGDIIELENHTFKDGTKGKAAKKLVSKGQWKDRDYNEFKFKAALGLLKIDKKTAQKFKQEIDRFKKEKLSGLFSYPSIVDIVKKLDKFLNG